MRRYLLRLSSCRPTWHAHRAIWLQRKQRQQLRIHLA